MVFFIPAPILVSLIFLHVILGLVSLMLKLLTVYFEKNLLRCNFYFLKYFVSEITYWLVKKDILSIKN